MNDYKRLDHLDFDMINWWTNGADTERNNKNKIIMIPTAPELLKDMAEDFDIEHIMIEFAKLHVELALKLAAHKATASAYYSTDNDGTYDAKVHKQSILTSYPLDLIK